MNLANERILQMVVMVLLVVRKFSTKVWISEMQLILNFGLPEVRMCGRKYSQRMSIVEL